MPDGNSGTGNNGSAGGGTGTATPPAGGAGAGAGAGGENTPPPIAGKFKDVGAAIGGIGGLFTKLGYGKPEEFEGKTPDEIAGRVYSHFEQELGKRASEKKPDAAAAKPGTGTGITLPADPPAEGGKNEGDDALNDESGFDAVLTKSKLDPKAIEKTLLETGTLPQEDVDAIAKATHLPKRLVKEYAELIADRHQLQTIKAAEARNDAVSLFGGEEKMGNVLAWAKTFYPADQHEAINKALSGVGTYSNQIKAMLHDYAADTKTGGSRPLINGGAASASSAGGPWKDTEPMLKDIADHERRTGKPWHHDAGMRARMAATSDAVKRGKK